MNKKLFLLLVIMLSVFIIISCSTPVKNEHVTKAVNLSDDLTTKAKETLTEFYKLLADERYEECLNYFSSTLFTYPGPDILSAGLKGRNKTNGLTVRHEVLYQTEIIDQNIGDLIVFHTKCFTLEGKYHFENINFSNNKGSFKIEIYEYGNLPYVSIEKANDTASQINIFLTEMYKLIDKNSFDDILPIIDEEIIRRIGMEKIKIGFEQEVVIKRGITNFVVETITSEMLENVPCVVMTINEISDKGSNRIDVTLSCRSDDYRLVFLKDNPLDDDKDKLY